MTETFREFLIRLGFESGQHVGSSWTYHYGTPKKAGEYTVRYPIRVDWSAQRGLMRAFFFTVWRGDEVVYDGLGEPDREFIQQQVDFVNGGGM